MLSMTAAFRQIVKYLMMTLTARNAKKGIRNKMELVQTLGVIPMAMILIGIAENALQAIALTTVNCATQVNQAFALQENIFQTHPAYRYQLTIA